MLQVAAPGLSRPTRAACAARDGRPPSCCHAPDRLTTPLARAHGERRCCAASWDEALDRDRRGMRAIQAEYGARRGRRVRRRRADQREGLCARQVRPRRAAAPRTSTTTAASAWPRPRRRGIRAFGIDRGLPFPLADIPHADAILLVGGNPAETMPPVMQYFDAQRRGRRQADRRRPAPDGDRAGGRPASAAHPRHRRGAGQRPAAHRHQRRADRPRLHRGAHHRLRGRAPHLRDLLARPGGADHRRAGEARSCGPRTSLGEAPHRDGADRARAGAAEPGCRQRRWRSSTWRSRWARPGRPYCGYGCLTGQGNGQGGREHGQKADQLPGYRKHRQPGAPRGDRRGLGR